ncbi:uncharacterized protein SPPG_00016 [Spizellomyces punctatus DAOM BR117]|uniref:CBS domain-containing protein n=1 Tax=Spizellomyces punctatus (strain DAOM BR117) TaxID=645134 RepID=A0A0L0HT39_SPIPD|nr:uncharacterized protein SPPG_00016 [Spizellomyces punctatus DAOM BR117]KND04278.1 hypothetical protein SPPG_00016 [Spizellomyces punctatus DAOM BR117]|eukprot:XP_016612317.1 hypothetical protein SPPG_00016 [Spizellomyces punctatus DAOM BR117]
MPHHAHPPALLDRYTLEDVLKDKPAEKLVQVHADASALDALTLMKNHHILAVPVYGEKGRWLGAGGTEAFAGSRQYIGVVSILDIVDFITTLLPDDLGAPLPSHATTGPHPDLSHIRVMDLIGETLESRSLWVARPDVPLRRSVEPMGRGVHRLLVPTRPDSADAALGAHGPASIALEAGPDTMSNEFRIVTQTDVIRFLLHRLNEDPELAKICSASLERLGLADQSNSVIITADISAPLSTIIKQMTLHNLNAIPVTNSHLNGTVVATLSVSDLRPFLISETDLVDIVRDLRRLTVGEFLRRVKGDWSGEVGGEKTGVKCRAEASLRSVMELGVEKAVHRVWVVDREGVPIGVVTFTDVIRLVEAEVLARS